jgi:hypothetical protein
MIVERLLAAQIPAVQQFVDPPGFLPSGTHRKVDGFGNREDPHLTQFHAKGGLISQTGFELATNLFEGDFERTGWEEGKVTASFTSRLYFPAEAFDKARYGLGNVCHQREGINSGSFPARTIHVLSSLL